MKVTFANETYDCTKAVREHKKATLYLTDGGTVEFSGVSDSAWDNFHFDGGSWEFAGPTELERLRADIDLLSVMTGVVL